jgi:hypothetical protein
MGFEDLYETLCLAAAKYIGPISIKFGVADSRLGYIDFGVLIPAASLLAFIDL